MKSELESGGSIRGVARKYGMNEATFRKHLKGVSKIS